MENHKSSLKIHIGPLKSTLCAEDKSQNKINIFPQAQNNPEDMILHMIRKCEIITFREGVE